MYLGSLHLRFHPFSIACIFFSFLFIICSLSGCGTASSSGSGGGTVTDIYAVGGEAGSVGYWENGSYVSLSSADGEAYGIAVANGHVYVAGNLKDATTGYDQPALWVDGTLTLLSAGPVNNAAYCIAVSGTDVYVGGFVSDQNGTSVPTIWKNGVASSLVEGISGSPPNEAVRGGATVFQVAVAGGTVYAAGDQEVYDETSPNNYLVVDTATLWTNGSPATLTNAPQSSEAYGLAISGNDVYVGGYILPQQALNTPYVPTVWLNGQVTTQAGAESVGGQVYSVAVSGSNVYAAGSLGSAIEVWQNAQPLYSGLSGVQGGLAVNGSDVYVGAEQISTSTSGNNIFTPGYYKNGNFVPLTDSNTSLPAAVNAIVVVTESNPESDLPHSMKE